MEYVLFVIATCSWELSSCNFKHVLYAIQNICSSRRHLHSPAVQSSQIIKPLEPQCFLFVLNLWNGTIPVSQVHCVNSCDHRYRARVWWSVVCIKWSWENIHPYGKQSIPFIFINSALTNLFAHMYQFDFFVHHQRNQGNIEKLKLYAKFGVLMIKNYILRIQRLLKKNRKESPSSSYFVMN